jgi:hypothetical protein
VSVDTKEMRRIVQAIRAQEHCSALEHDAEAALESAADEINHLRDWKYTAEQEWDRLIAERKEAESAHAATKLELDELRKHIAILREAQQRNVDGLVSAHEATKLEHAKAEALWCEVDAVSNARVKLIEERQELPLPDARNLPAHGRSLVRRLHPRRQHRSSLASGDGHPRPRNLRR